MQGDNVLTLSFTLYEHVALEVNDYADFRGQRYWLMERYRPEQKSTVEWQYDVKLYGVESLIKRFLVLNDTDGNDEPVFTLTAPPKEHVALIVKSINNGMGHTTEWKVGTVVGSDNIVIDYEGKYCDEALKEVAEKAGNSAEWWVDGLMVNVCRCEIGEEVVLGYGKGLMGISSDMADNTSFYTRLYPIGSSRNIDPEKYGHTRLQLPGGVKHVDINVEKYGIWHRYEADAFVDIYPKYIGTVSSVRSEEVTGEDGNPFKIFYFKDDSLDFDPNSYEIGSKVKRISFQEGSELAGLGNEEDGTYYFETNYDSQTHEFELITIWPYSDDTQLPNDTLCPQVGDRYILWNIRMPDEYYPLAEQEFKEAVDRYNEENAIDAGRYKGSTDHVYVEENGIDLYVGRRVRLESLQYFPETGYRSSRITKVTRKVGLPSQMDVEISDAVSIGTMEHIDGSISDAKNYVKTAIAKGFPELIRSRDNTLPTDSNVFSALRSLRQFTRKDIDDTVAGLLSFAKGLQSTGYTSGTLGTGFGLFKDVDGMSYLELDRLYVRYKAIFDTLEVKHISHVGGEFVVSPAGMECIRVEKVSGIPSAWQPLADSQARALYDSQGRRLNAVAQRSAAYRCYFRSTDGERTIENQFAVGDQAMCREFNITGGSVNRYYWRKVIGMGADYIDLSVTDCLSGSGIPQAGDSIVTVGNDRDTTRRHAIVISSYGGNAPSIMLYTGIDSYSLEGKAIFEVTPDGVNIKVGSFNGTFTGKFNIEVGSSGLENMDGYGDLTDGIAEAVDAAEKAQQTAEKAQQTADDAAADATVAVNELADMSSDDLISPQEKTALRQQSADIRSEYPQIIADAVRYSVTYGDYSVAYSKASAALGKYTKDTPEYIAVETDYADIAAYYPARQNVLNAIAKAAKDNADEIASDLDGFKQSTSASLSLLSSQISSKVERTVYESGMSEVKSDISEIRQTATDISLTVKSRGRNLYLNSGLQLGTEHWRLFDNYSGNSLTADRSTGELTMKSDGNNVLYNDYIDVAEGEQFTLSGEAYAANAVSLNYNYLIYESGGNAQMGSSVQLTAGQWKKFSITFKAPRAGKASAGAGFMANTTVKFRRLKWERGAIATDWNEADGDAPEQLAVTGIYVEEGIIRLRADNTYFTNSSGGQVAVFTADGKLSVDLIDVDELVARRVKTSESGRRVVIEGNELSMFNDGGELRMKVTGGELSEASAGGSAAVKDGRIEFNTLEEGMQGKEQELSSFSLTGSNNIVTIPRISVNMRLDIIESSGWLRGDVSLLLDGNRSIWNSQWTKPQDGTVIPSLVFPGMQTSLSAGTHTLKLKFSIGGNASMNGASVTSTTPAAPHTISWVYTNRLTEVAADGFRSSAGAAVYLELTDAGPAMRCGNYGFRITSAGFQQMTDGATWHNVSQLSTLSENNDAN